MKAKTIVSKDQWLDARLRHLAREKELTRLRDEISRERRELPWVAVENNYVFDTPTGKRSLAELFAGREQLLVYHFMLGPEWSEGCKSCSFWADNFNGIDIHLQHRDVTLLAISSAPLAKIEAYKKRMSWSFEWVSSHGSDFNRDFQVSFTKEELAKGDVYYNYQMRKFPADEAPGISVFAKDDLGKVYHTYSCYSRGLDMLNGAYHFLDLVPKGRDEEGLPYGMAWVRHHDKYTD
ncbi:MAG: DUF899 domain-containing protein [Burkholderiales bacterium]